MTIRLLMLSASALLISSCDSTTAPADDTSTEATDSAVNDTSAADEEAIRAKLATWLEIVEAKDAAAIAQLYTEDGVVMPPNAPAGQGAAAIEQTWAGMMGAPGFDLTFTPEQIVVSSSGDMAMDRGTYQLAMTPDGEAVSDTGKYVVVWRKVDGEWKAAADIFNSDMPAGG